MRRIGGNAAAGTYQACCLYQDEVRDRNKQQKANHMKLIKNILVLASAGLLMVGCASENHNSGAMGNDAETGAGYNQSTQPQPMNGPDGSVSPSNPLGLGSGTRLTPAN
jgi:hypothetical protein